MDFAGISKTPIQKLSESLNKNKFFIKRDDLFPVSLGGNKARKAVLFFDEVENGQFDCVVTYGSSSSNHCRVVANIARSKGIPCHIISPDETIKTTFNSQIVELLGAVTTKCPVAEVASTIEQKLKELKAQGYKPYFIQGGGHGNIGTQAYVKAYEEIVSYEKETGIHFDYIFHTSGTGTTQAGLVCGQLIHHDVRNIVGISIARKTPYGSDVVRESVKSYLDSIGLANTDHKPIHFVDDYVLDGYGTYNDSVLQTIESVFQYDGIPFDTTYTGKAFWGMKEYIKKNRIANKNILFIHTGGIPLFFDDLRKREKNE